MEGKGEPQGVATGGCGGVTGSSDGELEGESRGIATGSCGVVTGSRDGECRARGSSDGE